MVNIEKVHCEDFREWARLRDWLKIKASVYEEESVETYITPFGNIVIVTISIEAQEVKKIDNILE